MERAIADRKPSLAGVLCIAFLLPVACDEAPPPSEPRAVELLETMLEAEDALSYRATKRMVWGHGEEARETEIPVVHYAGGPTCFKGRQRRSRLYWLKDRELLLSNYRVALAGRRTFLERSAFRLEISSRHEGRPSMGLTVDEETGLLLSTDIRDFAGRRVLRSEFVTLDLDPELPEPPAPRTGPSRWGGGGADRGEEVPTGTFVALVPGYLPAGFVEKKRYDSPRRPGLKILYGDGLGSLSVSQRPVGPGEGGEPVVKQRQVGSLTKLEAVLSGIEVTVAGQVSPEELLEVLESLAPEGKE